MSDLMQYEELTARMEAAYAYHSRQYELRFPPPQPTAVESDDRFVKLALGVMIVASLIVSASSTIPTFVGDISRLSGVAIAIAVIVGLAVFTMIDVGIIAYAYTRTKHHYRLYPDKPTNIARLMGAGFGLALAVAIAANIHHHLATSGFNSGIGWDVFEFIFRALIGLSAPTLAFISGDILGMLVVVDGQRARKAEREYNELLIAYNKAKDDSWNAQKARLGIRVEVEPVKSLNLIKSNELTARNKPSPKLQKAMNWLIENEGHLNTAPRELEASIPGVSYGTIFKAQQLLKSENNGAAE